jgi:carboxymethylenebutenolidase
MMTTGGAMQAKLDQAKLRMDMLNGAKFLKAHALSTGKVGATGFCWGGGTTNFLAAEMGADLGAAAPFYGVAADTASVAKIKAPVLAHLARDGREHQRDVPGVRSRDEGGGRALRGAHVPGTQHGFHNNSTPRYQEAAAKLAWERTSRTSRSISHSACHRVVVRRRTCRRWVQRSAGFAY